MKFVIAMALAVTLWTVGLLHAASAAQSPAAAASTWSGVYTDAQAQAGAEAYATHCAECHGQDLAGDGFAPGLRGPEFMNNWNGLTVGELFDRIRISMPPSDPDAASAKEKSDITAYLLKQSGFPAGATPLATSTDALKTIKFEAVKPAP